MTIPLLPLTPWMNYATGGGESAGLAQALRIFKANLSTQEHIRNRARLPIDPKSGSSTAPLTCHQPREAAGRTMPKISWRLHPRLRNVIRAFSARTISPSHDSRYLWSHS
jgi:hypothetical protein